MSRATARRVGRTTRHVCLECRERHAKFQYRGEVRADRDHNLCFQCFRAEINRQRARRLSQFGTLPVRSLLARQAHAHDLIACA